MEDNELLQIFDSKLNKYVTIVNDLKEQVNKGIAAQGKLGAGAQFGSPFEQELSRKLTEAIPQLENFKANKIPFSINLESKVVGDTTFGNVTGQHPSAEMVPGYTPKLYETNHIRQYFPNASTQSNEVRYPIDKGGEGGPTTVAEAALKPQADRDISILTAPTRKIAVFYRCSEEILMDLTYMQSLLSAMGSEELMQVESQQLLYGDGVAPNLTGLKIGGTAFAAGTSVIGASANNLDVLLASKKQLRQNKFGGQLFAFINPDDAFKLLTSKDTANNYTMLAPSLSPLNSATSVAGIQIVETTSVTAGDFFVASPMAATVVDRLGTSIRFLQGAEDLVHNLVTVVIEKRLAFPILRPTGSIYGTFAAAITDLTT